MVYYYSSVIHFLYITWRLARLQIRANTVFGDEANGDICALGLSISLLTLNIKE